MLQELSADQARQIADLAKTARTARDVILDNVPEEDLGVPRSARGEHNPAGTLGFDPLPLDDPALIELRATVCALVPAARAELFVLMRMGQGDFAICDWDRGLSEAALLGDDTVLAALTEDADLHEHLSKALYELGTESRA
jgi:Protein of unknown function (DUF3775)